MDQNSAISKTIPGKYLILHWSRWPGT
ncbi:hypothetical protein Bhyg_06370, partial [Pseudolycoriella hygida]